jgi:hypothetical protein
VRAQLVAAHRLHVAVAQHADALDRREELLGAGGPVALAQELDAALERAQVLVVQVV